MIRESFTKSIMYEDALVIILNFLNKSNCFPSLGGLDEVAVIYELTQLSYLMF